MTAQAGDEQRADAHEAIAKQSFHCHVTDSFGSLTDGEENSFLHGRGIGCGFG